MDLTSHLECFGVAFEGPVPTVRRNDRTDVLIEVRCIDCADEVEQFSQDALALLRQHISRHDAIVASKMLGELLDNATTHADSPTGAFVCAQVYRRGPELELAVADGGIGIPAHLARNPRFRGLDEVQALEAALLPGVSGTSESRGNGLSDLLDLTSGYGGKVVLRSRSGHALVTTVNNRRSFQVGTSVPGTCAAVRIGLPPVPRAKMT